MAIYNGIEFHHSSAHGWLYKDSEGKVRKMKIASSASEEEAVNWLKHNVSKPWTHK